MAKDAIAKWPHLDGPLLTDQAPEIFFNVVLPDGADPWVIRHSDGYYYMTVSTGINVTLWRSRSLSGLGGGEKKIVWTPPAFGPSSKNFWAPELHHVNGKWYIYAAADDGRWENHRMYAFENPNADPFQGEFVERGKVFDPKADKWAIDATLLNLKGKLYFIWSGWEGDENVHQILYIAAMSDPVTLSGPRVEISRPRHAWETIGSDFSKRLPTVNEGPEVLIRGDAVHIVYSAGGSWTDDYCLGLLTAKLNSNLLSPSSWKKHDQPIFQRGNGVRAPGHCSFVKSSDGKEDWLVYHAARYPGANWNRHVRIQPFAWNNGVPQFGRPSDPNVPIPIPSGDPVHTRYEAEKAKLGGVARIIPRPDASGQAKVGYIDSPESFVEFNVVASKAGKHVVSVRCGNGTSDKLVSSHKISVNDTAIGTLSYPNSGWDNWTNVFLSVELKTGNNKLRFSKGDHFVEIDCLDVFPLEP